MISITVLDTQENIDFLESLYPQFGKKLIINSNEDNEPCSEIESMRQCSNY